MPTIICTGGCGFIGSNFIRYALEKHPDWTVSNIDKLTYAGDVRHAKEMLKAYPQRYFFFKDDICNDSVVNDLMAGVDICFHFAAATHVDRSIKEPWLFTKTNVLGTQTLLEAARRTGTKLVHISTDEVYGSIDKGSFTEESPFKPNSPYSASKASAELLARAYNKTYNLPVVITRSSNNFGPYQFREKLIPLFITNLLKGKKVPVYGTGLNVRDWLYVKDNCDAIDYVAEHGALGEAYNIGGGNERTNLEITNMILKELGKDESSIEHVADRAGHDFRYSLDCSKLAKLGWAPKHSFEAALRETIEWYRKNRGWWDMSTTTV